MKMSAIRAYFHNFTSENVDWQTILFGVGLLLAALPPKRSPGVLGQGMLPCYNLKLTLDSCKS